MRESTVATLGDFILEEMKLRDMSAREFAELMSVPHATINKYLNHGKTETYGGKPIGNPSIEFIQKLSETTKIDICTIMDLITGNASDRDNRARLLAERIARLSVEDQEIIDRYLLGTPFKG